MLVKNLVKCQEVDDKTDHTPISQVTFTRKNHRETSQVTLFYENAPTMWDRHKLKGALKPSVFTPIA